MPQRLDKDLYGLLIARIVSLRGTCVRRTVGCVLADTHRHILSTGYNGNFAAEPHCIDKPCAGASDKHGDTRRCDAIHAEMNAILQCEQRREVRFVYCTDSPCRECAKAIRALPGVQEVHYGRFYTAEGIDILINGGIRVIGHEELFGTPLNLILQQYERGTR